MRDYLFLDRKILSKHGPNLAIFMAAVRDICEQRLAEEQRNPQPDPHEEKARLMLPGISRLMVDKEDGSVSIYNSELHELTGMSDFQLLNCKKAAEKHGYLKIRRKGVPATQHYLILDKQ